MGWSEKVFLLVFRSEVVFLLLVSRIIFYLLSNECIEKSLVGY